MKVETFSLVILLNSVMLLFISAVVYFVNELFKFGMSPMDCLSIGGAIILFLVYPYLASAVRRPTKK